MKILILGVGSAQRDALRYCRDAGLEVHACGQSAEGAGRSLAGHFAVIDIRDATSVEDYVKRNGIDLVYSVGSDVAMPTASAVSERLGLPCFVSSETTRTCQDKYLMRETLGQGFAGNVPYQLVKVPEEADSWDVFPCVMKPVDNQGQRGVFFLQNREDFEKHYPQSRGFSRTGQVILEGYAGGPEISANVFVVGGRLEFIQVTDRVVFAEYPGGIVKEHHIPSKNAAGDGPVRELCERVLEKLGISEGPAYFQMKLPGGNPVLVEVTPRLDGCHLWRLIREYTGVDLLDATFRHLLGRELPSFEKTIGARPLVLEFPSQETGSRCDQARFEFDSALYHEWYYAQGEVVRPINGYMEKVGYLIR